MKSLLTKAEFLMTLPGKNVWQEREEAHQEEIKINQAEKLWEMS